LTSRPTHKYSITQKKAWRDEGTNAAHGAQPGIEERVRDSVAPSVYTLSANQPDKWSKLAIQPWLGLTES